MVTSNLFSGKTFAQTQHELIKPTTEQLIND